MKIVLLQSVRGLGNPGDIVNVKSGYARNYLIPKDIAIYATIANIKHTENRIAKAKEIELAQVEKLKLIAEKLDKLSLKFLLKSGEEDKLFGSVTSTMIADGIESEGYKVDKKEIHLDEPIKHLGNHFVEIHLAHELSAKVKIKVSAIK